MKASNRLRIAEDTETPPPGVTVEALALFGLDSESRAIEIERMRREEQADPTAETLKGFLRAARTLARRPDLLDGFDRRAIQRAAAAIQTACEAHTAARELDRCLKGRAA